jgi:hypothetical protein
MIPLDELQNHLILLSHHIDDVREALEDGDDTIIEASLDDMEEIIGELKAYLPEGLAREVEAKEMGMDSNVEEIAKDVW